MTGQKIPNSYVIFSIVALTVAVLFGIYFIQNEKLSNSQLNYWPIHLRSRRIGEKYDLDIVERVLDLIGHKKVNGSIGEDWDIMWSVEEPFEHFEDELKNVKPHQLINHFPGITFLTNKKHLAVSSQSKYIPVAYDFPRLKNEFMYYFKLNDHKQFIQKHFNTGSMQIVGFEDINFLLGDEDYVQEFIANPLLIEDRAFDLGVFVLITSFDPLRLYRWKSDITLRFCSEPYHPFDPKNLDKFLPNRNFSSIWELPSFNATNNIDFSAKDLFHFILLEQGKNVAKLWEQIDDAIVSSTLIKSSQIQRYVKMFQRNHNGQKGRFFELLRFDFILDSDMNVHLMEVNMSPSLTPQYGRQTVLFEQMVRNTISIMGGAGRRNEMETTCVGNEIFCPRTDNALNDSLLLSAPWNVAVDFKNCANCQESCEDSSCGLCLPCLSKDSLLDLLQAYREHQKRGEMKRLYPNKLYLKDNIMERLSEANRLSVRWFKAKCDEDRDWC